MINSSHSLSQIETHIAQKNAVVSIMLLAIFLQDNSSSGTIKNHKKELSFLYLYLSGNRAMISVSSVLSVWIVLTVVRHRGQWMMPVPNLILSSLTQGSKKTCAQFNRLGLQRRSRQTGQQKLD